MNATGIVRRFDELGRINIPKELRKQIFGTQCSEGKPMEFFMDGNDIVLRKYEDSEERKEKEIRNKAIDEFAELLNKKISEFVLQHKDNLTFASGVSVAWHMVDEIAEEMKEKDT